MFNKNKRKTYPATFRDGLTVREMQESVAAPSRVPLSGLCFGCGTVSFRYAPRSTPTRNFAIPRIPPRRSEMQMTHCHQEHKLTTNFLLPKVMKSCLGQTERTMFKNDENDENDENDKNGGEW